MIFHWQEFSYRILSCFLAALAISLLIETYPESFGPWWWTELPSSFSIFNGVLPVILYHFWAFLTPGLYKFEGVFFNRLLLIFSFVYFSLTFILYFILYPGIHTLGREGSLHDLIQESHFSAFLLAFSFLLTTLFSIRLLIYWRVFIWFLFLCIWTASCWDSLSDFFWLFLLSWEFFIFYLERWPSGRRRVFWTYLT